MKRIAGAFFGLLLLFSFVPASAQDLPAGIYREQGVNPSGERYVGMAAIVPDGSVVRITWWIERDVFTGTGKLDGDKLVVDWGQDDPVVYALRPGVLEGTWAAGAAKDRLELYAPILPAAAPDPVGQYRGDGFNPNGEPYSATVDITRRADGYQFFWIAGGTNYSGVGRREGNLMIVDWGDVMPMIYALDPDGTLSGIFDAGRGSEKLTPARI